MHARTLLVNLPDPADVAAEMARLARSGGQVASMEPDTEHGRCHPPHPAFDRLCDIFTVAFGRNGADPWIGGGYRSCSARRDLRCPGRGQGADVPAGQFPADHPPGSGPRMRPQVLEMGLASAAELDELDTAARAHLQDPHTIVISGLLFLTWGRKPHRMQHDLPPAS